MNSSELSEKSQQTPYIDESTFFVKFYPWLVWSLVASFFLYKYVLQVSPSVITSNLMQSFSITGAQLGNLAACFSYTYLIMQIPAGMLLDRYSPRVITTIAIAACALGTFLFADAQSVFVAELSRALMGFGAAFAAISCLKMTSVWFPSHRFAFVAGLSMTAAMLGAICGEAPLSMLVHHFNWREALHLLAMPGVVLAFLVAICVRDKLTQKNKLSSESLLTFTDLRRQLAKSLREKQTWLLSIYSGLAFAPVSVFGGLWGVSFLQQAHHLSAVAAASSTSLIFMGFAMGCPIAGFLSDLFSRRNIIMLAGTLLSFITLSAVIYAPNLTPLELNLLLFGFGFGASCFLLCFSMIREIHPLIFAATMVGFMNTFDSLCEAFSEPMIGKLLDLGWHGTMNQGARVFSLADYHHAFLILPLYLGVALILLFFIKETYCHQN